LIRSDRHNWKPWTDMLLRLNLSDTIIIVLVSFDGYRGLGLHPFFYNFAFALRYYVKTHATDSLVGLNPIKIIVELSHGQCCDTQQYLGPDFRKILRRIYDRKFVITKLRRIYNRKIVITKLRRIYDRKNANFRKLLWRFYDLGLWQSMITNFQS